MIAALQGDFGRAREQLEVAATQLQGIHMYEYAKLLCRRVHVEVLAGAPETAEEALAEAEKLAEELGGRDTSELGRMVAEAREALGTCREALGN